MSDPICLICCARLVDPDPDQDSNCDTDHSDRGKILCQLLRLPLGEYADTECPHGNSDLDLSASFEQVFQSASYCPTCDWKVKAVGQILKEIEQLESRLDVHRLEIEEHLQNNLNTGNSHPKDDANANQFAWNVVINYIHKNRSKDFEPPSELGLVDPLEINNEGQSHEHLDSGDPDLCDSSFNFDNYSVEDHEEKFDPCQEFVAQELTSNRANNANFSISHHDDPEEKSKIMKSAFPIIRLIRLEDITDSECAKVKLKLKVRQVKIGPDSNSAKLKRKPKPKSKRNTPPKRKSKDDYPCGHDDICPARFASLRKRHAHITAEHNDGIPALFLCPFCKTDFGHLVALRQHVLSVHEPHKVKFKCEEPGCGKVFSSRTHLNDHKDTHTKAQRYLCEFCSEPFLSSQRLRYHRVAKHAAEANLEPYKCKICAQTFATPANLRDHNRRIHLKIFRFKCTICGFGVQSKSELEKHELRFHRHENERPFMCDKCPATFKFHSDLRKHAQIHALSDMPRGHKCTTCGATFMFKDGLRRHELALHSKAQTHVCTICGKAFPIKNYLTNHINYSHKNKRCPSQSVKGKGGSGSAVQIHENSSKVDSPDSQNSNNTVV